MDEDMIHKEPWVLDMWLETCKNHGIEVEHSDNVSVLRIRTIIAMRKAGLMD